MKTVYTEVATKIAGCGPLVKDTVVSKVAEVEITRRTNIILTALEINDSLEKELKKVNREDIVTYEAGVEKKTMSKNRFEEINKLKDSLGELDKAVTTALNDNTDDSYQKLASLSDRLKARKQNGGDKEHSG